MADNAWFVVTLREWVENQRLESTEHQAALSAAMNAADTVAIRLLLGDAPFSGAQRRYLEDLLRRWEAAMSQDDEV
jgi:hypothetical protein